MAGAPLLSSVAIAWLTLLAAPQADGPGSGPGERFTTSRSGRELALPEPNDGYVFAVFGDRTGGPREGVRVLERAVEEVVAFGPEMVLTVGDLIEGYTGTATWMEQMREFRGVMDRLPVPWFPVAGNHDIYWRGEEPAPPGQHEAHYEEHFGPLWYAFRHREDWFVVLYTDEGDPATGRKDFNDPAAQRMSPEQLAWLDETLTLAAGGRHVFVFLHHPRWLARYGDDWDRVHARLARAGNVRAVFAGHIHTMRYDGARDGIEYFAMATTGGHLSAEIPRAGLLHHFCLVTVDGDGLTVATVPVGASFDARRIRADLGGEARRASAALGPAFPGSVALRSDGVPAAPVEAVLSNPGPWPVTVELRADPRDPRWTLAIAEPRATLAPGAERAFTVVAERPAASLDDGLRLPALTVSATMNGPDGWDVPLDERSVELPLTPPPLAPRLGDHELALDGRRAHAAVAHAAIPLPADSPLTLEGWLCADEFRPRQGFVTKTESSEYGLFVNGGSPSFWIHLGGRYVGLEPDVQLEPGRWHHLAGVWDGSEARLYVDGERVAGQAASGLRTIRAVPLVVGADVDGSGGPSSPLRGRVDGVRLSGVARYDAAFEPARGAGATDPNTLLSLEMDGVGPWVRDGSGRGAHGVLRGGARRVRAD